MSSYLILKAWHKNIPCDYHYRLLNLVLSVLSAPKALALDQIPWYMPHLWLFLLNTVSWTTFLLTGAAAIASLGDNSARLSVKDETKNSKAFHFCAQREKLAVFADLFATFSFSAQHGNFQRRFLDLTRLNARLDFPSGLSFVAGAVRLAENFYNSQLPDSGAIHAVLPDLTVSLQQQVSIVLSYLNL